MIFRASSAVDASTITAPCLVIVSTLSSITLNFAIAASRTRALESGHGKLYQRGRQYQGGKRPVDLFSTAAYHHLNAFPSCNFFRGFYCFLQSAMNGTRPASPRPPNCPAFLVWNNVKGSFLLSAHQFNHPRNAVANRT